MVSLMLFKVQQAAAESAIRLAGRCWYYCVAQNWGANGSMQFTQSRATAQTTGIARDLLSPVNAATPTSVADMWQLAGNRMHADRSGFEGPWVEDPTRFTNAYFIDILKGKWEEGVSSAGNKQFFDKAKGTAMVPTDLVLATDPIFRPLVEKYAADLQAFYADFAVSYQKLQELGCSNLIAIDV
ncbi:heme peroxidase [Chytridium lagenaria]|nr:heme peroxidase [Chytridium lagenaria]